jgi:O-antigen/teichoic acid export membrane protein
MPTTEPAAKTPGLAVQAFWLIVARTAGFAFTLAMPLVMVRVFTQEQFGTYKQAFVIVATCVSLLHFNVGVSAFYYFGRMPEKRHALIFNIVVYHAFIGAVAMAVLVLWPGVVGRLNTDLAPMSALLGAVVFTWVFSSFLELVATANQDVAHSTAFIILAQLTKAILLITAAVQFHTVAAVLYAALAQGLLQSVVMLWYLQHRFPYFWRHPSKQLAVEQVTYVLPIGIAGLLIGVQTDIHNYVVAYSFDTVQYAIYAVGTSQIPLMGILSQSINSVMQSRMSKLQQDRSTDVMARLLFRSWRTLAFVFVPAAVLLFAVRYDFIVLLYEKDYLDSVPIFAVNLLLLIQGIFVTDAAVRAHAELRFWFLRLRIIAVILQLVLSMALIRRFGPIGALLAMIAAMCFERFFNVRRICQVLDAGPRQSRMLRELGVIALCSIAAGAVTALCLTLLPTVAPVARLLIAGPLFGSLYVMALLGLNVLDRDEREVLSRYLHSTLRMFRHRVSPGSA